MESRFADFFRALRKQKFLSQKQLAERAALSLRTVVYWETGEREPRAEELKSALTALGATQVEREQAYLLQTTQRGIALVREKLRTDAISSTSNVPIPDLGDLLAALRVRAGWSRDQLAQRMQVNRSTVTRWERTEQLPTEENVNRLCTLLAAYPAERDALFTRRLLPQIPQAQASPDSYEMKVRSFCADVDQLQTPLIDLNALSLKRELYLAKKYSPHMEVLIARIETYHGIWLVLQNRYGEAANCVDRALHLASMHIHTCDFLHTTLNVAACCAGAEPTDGPVKSLRLLRRWHTVVSAPKSRFSLYCDMAYYAGEAGYHDSALRFLQVAQCTMRDLPLEADDVRNYATTHARVLMRANRPGEALKFLPEVNEPGYRNLFHTYLKATMLLDDGETNEAHRCIDYLCTNLERYPSRLFQQRVDRLAERL